MAIGRSFMGRRSSGRCRSRRRTLPRITEPRPMGHVAPGSAPHPTFPRSRVGDGRRSVDRPPPARPLPSWGPDPTPTSWDPRPHA